MSVLRWKRQSILMIRNIAVIINKESMIQTLRGAYNEVLQSCPVAGFPMVQTSETGSCEISAGLKHLAIDNTFCTADMFCLLFDCMCLQIAQGITLPENRNVFFAYLEILLRKYELRKYLYERYSLDEVKPASKTKASSCAYFLMILNLLAGYCLEGDIRYVNTSLKLGDQIAATGNESISVVYQKKILPVIKTIVDRI